jgi:hypothetical protein
MADSRISSLRDNHQREPLIIVATIFSFIGSRYIFLSSALESNLFLALVIFTRLYIRKFVVKSLGWDDYTIIVAWVSK